MYRLIRKYFENGTEDEEIVKTSESEKEVIKMFKSELKTDLDFGYVLDKEQNELYNVRLFLGHQENWNDYIEMYIVRLETEKIEKK